MYCFRAHGNQDTHPEGVLRAETGVHSEEKEDSATERDPPEAGGGPRLGAQHPRASDRRHLGHDPRGSRHPDLARLCRSRRPGRRGDGRWEPIPVRGVAIRPPGGTGRHWSRDDRRQAQGRRQAPGRRRHRHLHRLAGPVSPHDRGRGLGAEPGTGRGPGWRSRLPDCVPDAEDPRNVGGLRRARLCDGDGRAHHDPDQCS